MAAPSATRLEASRAEPLAHAEPGQPWQTAGPADGPPIVFLHGAIMTRAQWRPQVARLSEAGYHCITIDLPGHGARAREPFTLDRAVEAATDAIDRAAGGRAVLVGLSLGGYVATAVAGRSPERVRGLVLAGSTTEPAGPIRAAFEIVGWGHRLVPERLQLMAYRWLWRRRYGDAGVAEILAEGYFGRGGSVAIRRLPGGRFRDRLRAYGGPILVINGDLDLVFRVGERAFVEGLPNVTRRALRGAAHLSNLDRPDEFSAAVEAFVGRLGP